MGCCAASAPAPITIIILGTSGVGKTTFFKQLKILHKNGFTDEETNNFKKIVYSNIVGGIADLIYVAENMKINLSKYEFEVNLFRDKTEANQLEQEHVQAAKTLWNAKELNTPEFTSDPQVKAITNDGNLQYFIDSIDTIAKPEYFPQNEDIVRCRQRTVGYTQLEFEFENGIIRVIDMGGHENEQMKWEAVGENAHSIIYLASLTHYDMEDTFHPGRTKLEESLQVFEEVLQKETFQECGLILFLNKYDLFAKQIKQKKFKESFPDYDGKEKDAEECANYIKSMYSSLLPNKRDIYVHLTCVVDTKVMQNIISDVMSWILQRNLADMGLYNV